MIRLVFLGCGAIAARHAKTIRSLRADVELSFASREKAKAEEYRSRFGGKHAFGSYQEAVESDAVDAAFIALPPALHLEWVKKALDREKHAIVEKPPFLSVAELDQAAKRAGEVGRRILVAENYYYKPITARVRSLIAEGAVGEVLFLHVNALKTQRVSGWRDEYGALIEGGIHWVNFMNNIGLTVAAAHGYRPGDRTGADRSMMISFEYQEGAVGSLYYSWEVPSPLKGIRISRIYGREGTISFESNGAFLWAQGKKLALSIAPGLSDAGGFKAMFTDFFRALEEGREPEMSLEKARRDLMQIERIQTRERGETRAA